MTDPPARIRTLAKRHWLLIPLLPVLVVLAVIVATRKPQTVDEYVESGEWADELVEDVAPELQPFFYLYLRAQVPEAIATLEESWDDRYVAMLLDMLRVRGHSSIETDVFNLLRRRVSKDVLYKRDAWWQWVWENDPGLHPSYADYKGEIYALIDPSFQKYFADDRAATIRLDEIRWGGVHRDGIPPLDQPTMIAAGEAAYLDDEHVVFGLEVNGDARAYPKRILAWHEMFKDTVGGEPVTGVYCTLCGSMILYRSVHDGEHHDLGTSGFLYRSNKLMYDQATYSLWSTLRGVPVVGPLVGRGIELEPLSVVTTTWGQWRAQHPDTTVLSLDTGHRRNYDEGVAYQDYFGTDELMFGVPKLDERLKNKDEVLALRFAGDPTQPLAITASYLAVNPIHHDALGDVDFVVLTDGSGANRVYEIGDRRFNAYDSTARTATDDASVTWSVTEAGLVSPEGQRLARLPSHRAFWFGWYAVYPDTRLVSLIPPDMR